MRHVISFSLLLLVLTTGAHAEPDIRPHLDRWRAWCERPSSLVVETSFHQTDSVFPGTGTPPHKFIIRLLVGLYPDQDLVQTEHAAAPLPLPVPREPCEAVFFAAGNRLWELTGGPESLHGWYTAINFMNDGTWASERSRSLGAAYAGLGFHGGFSDCDLLVFLSTLPAEAFDAAGVEVAGRAAVRFIARDTRLGDVTAVLDAATGVPFSLAIDRSTGHRYLDRRLPHKLPYVGDRTLLELGHREVVLTDWRFGEEGPVPASSTYREQWIFEEGIDAVEVVGRVLSYDAFNEGGARDFEADFPFAATLDYVPTGLPPAVN